MTKKYVTRFVVLEHNNDGSFMIQIWPSDTHGTLLFASSSDIDSWYAGSYKELFNGPNELLEILFV